MDEIMNYEEEEVMEPEETTEVESEETGMSTGVAMLIGAGLTVAAAAAVYGAKSLLSCFKSMTAQRAQIPPPHSRYIFIFRKCGV